MFPVACVHPILAIKFARSFILMMRVIKKIIKVEKEMW